MNTVILNGHDTARMRSMGLGCGCGCNECGNKPLNGTMDYLFNTPQIGKKAIGGAVGLSAVAVGLYFLLR